ncbi:hypothetical protein LTR37_012418 [Vermiconidia calcicola]|uniref:Uncharacterized protein n=1 Tax=Vermiconidia calcicola TaxID=1690605 RepID=A0ACC3MZA2_9PEZI|nr:hypothetical protein LTR37_012418 [Vermiconidia calcicola]
MASFNFSKLKEYIPSELPKVSLPLMPSFKMSGTELEDAETRHLDEQTANDSRQAAEAIAEDEPFSMVLAEPKPIPVGPKSNLDLINECDNFPYHQKNTQLYLAHINTYYGLYVKDYPNTELGYILPSVAEVFRGLPDWKLNDAERSLTLITGNNEEERSRAVAATTKAMRATEHFEVLKGWRDELYPVYGPDRELLFSMERAASALFGIVTYGVHMTAYTMKAEDGEDEAMRLWVPRRAANKQTYGGMLDNTVAGGISTGESPFESLVREAQEEASLPEDIVRRDVKAVGTVTYFHIRDHRAGGETRLLQPEVQYVYDLQVAEDVVPKPSDDEVAGFELKTVDEVQKALRDGEFKPNCALVLLDFFIRHNILTSEDPGYIEMVARLHRHLEFPTR